MDVLIRGLTHADKMRSEYGKLVYLLMDSAEPNIQDLLEFRCVRPLRTAYTALGKIRLHAATFAEQKSWFHTCVRSQQEHVWLL